jgi:uncharacterized protein (TIGR03000 family)
MVLSRFSFRVLAGLAGGLFFLTAAALQAQPPARAAGPYSPATSLTVIEGPSPIVMTSINYPGLYGSYFMGVPALTYNTRPSAGNFYTPDAGTVLAPHVVTLHENTPPAPPPAAEPAHVNILVPSEAAVSIQGVRMSQPGSFREFVSPPLLFDQDYTYTIRAAWPVNGREVAQERLIHVRAGQRVDVDLMTAPPAQGDTTTLRSLPLP